MRKLQDENLSEQELQTKESYYHSISTDLNYYQLIKFHQNVASRQRSVYQNHINNTNNVLNNKILIEVDFKQNIIIGLSPRQVSSEYRLQQTRSCLGDLLILIYYFCLAL